MSDHEALALAFLDGMYAVRQDEIEPAYAARKWAHRQRHWEADEQDRVIVAQMIATAPLVPEPAMSDARQAAAQYGVSVTGTESPRDLLVALLTERGHAHPGDVIDALDVLGFGLAVRSDGGDT